MPSFCPTFGNMPNSKILCQSEIFMPRFANLGMNMPNLATLGHVPFMSGWPDWEFRSQFWPNWEFGRALGIRNFGLGIFGKLGISWEFETILGILGKYWPFGQFPGHLGLKKCQKR